MKKSGQEMEKLVQDIREIREEMKELIEIKMHLEKMRKKFSETDAVPTEGSPKKQDYAKISSLSKDKEKTKISEMAYYELKNALETILKNSPEGLTENQLNEKMNKLQNLLIARLQDDARLKAENQNLRKLNSKKVFTIGYQGLRREDFILLLKENEIEQLLDIREVALSRKKGFSKTALMNGLKESGIRYKHMSSLGSPREIRRTLKENWDYETFFTEYRKHISDNEVREEITDLEGLSEVRRTAIMCFEKDWRTCHRSVLANYLESRDWQIVNLGDSTPVEVNAEPKLREVTARIE